MSRDASAVAFQADLLDPGNVDIYTMKTDGTELRRVTTDPGIDSGPDWSPDGTRIAFERTGDDGHPEIYVVRIDGQGEVRITNNEVVDAQPAWAPDSKRIVFMRNDGGNADIYSVDLRTGYEARLTASPAADADPAWAPTGDSIAFTSDENQDGHVDLNLMSSDGTRMMTVIEDATSEISGLSWAPDGQALAFTAAPSARLSGGLMLLDLQSERIRSLVAVTGPLVDWS